MAVTIHSLFFCLIPIWAFVLGYFTSWRWGILTGFVLFTIYTLTISLTRGLLSHMNLERLLFALPFDYLFNFVLGGFSLLFFGGIAFIVRKRGVRHITSILVIFSLAIMVGYCGYTSFPKYAHRYYVDFQAPDSGNLEIYLPVPAIAGEPYTEIFEHRTFPGDYTFDLVETEHGLMLMVNQRAREWGAVGSIHFRQENVPHQKVRLMPRYQVETIVGDNEHSKIFKVPLKISGGNNTNLEIRISVGTNLETNVNFYNHKTVTFYDYIKFQGEVAGDEWLFISGEERSDTWVSGFYLD